MKFDYIVYYTYTEYSTSNDHVVSKAQNSYTHTTQTTVLTSCKGFSRLAAVTIEAQAVDIVPAAGVASVVSRSALT